MRYILAAVLAASTSFAHADLVARQGSDYVRITNAPCPASIQTPPDWPREMANAAVASVNGHDYRGCWVFRPDGVVLLVYEDNDMGAVPISLFKNEPGV